MTYLILCSNAERQSYYLKITMMEISAGSIFDISKYRDTCESSIPIFSGIAILRYFWYRTPTVRYLRYFDTRHRVHSTMSMRRRNIVVDDDVVYGSYHYSASQPKLTKAWLFKNNIT